jgi:hypothetical protein
VTGEILLRHAIKQNVLNTLLYARRDWDNLLGQIDEGKLVQSGVCGQWSVKDIMAHVTWYEREMEELFRTRKLEGSPLWELDPAKRNEDIFKKNQFRSLDEVKQESLQIFARLLTAVESADPGDFFDPACIEGMPEDWEPLEILGMNTWTHYIHHAEHIRAFHQI